MTAGTPEWLEHGWEGAEDRGCWLGRGSGAGQGAPDPAQPPPPRINWAAHRAFCSADPSLEPSASKWPQNTSPKSTSPN